MGKLTTRESSGAKQKCLVPEVVLATLVALRELLAHEKGNQTVDMKKRHARLNYQAAKLSPNIGEKSAMRRPPRSKTDSFPMPLWWVQNNSPF